MKVVTAIDSFKGSLTSLEAGHGVETGFKRVDSAIEVNVRPLADGGEGTVDALTEGMHGDKVYVQVTGPLGDKVNCPYGIIAESQTAIIEMSGAAGITLIPRNQLDPMKATTYGVGEVIKDAINRGCRRFLIGIGGSATNDGGVGMLMALGYDFLDAQGQPIALGAQGLKDLEHIETSHVLPALQECSFKIACDVTNPLCGAQGASAIYGPQKGATSAQVLEMDGWLAHYAKCAQALDDTIDATYPGTGAAGGLGFAFKSFLQGELVSGISMVLEETKLEDAIKEADLVITGEGRLDGQTAMGKAPIGVAQLAKKHDKPVIAFAGCVTKDATLCNEHGIDAFFPIMRKATTLDEAMNHDNALNNLADTAEQVMRLIMMKGTK
ncbi:glycerate kinase [Intestinibaculum porci]|uniref:glycerate kinase family protein n=1 Tax=Intestinibaculum porci TaxID=2487118 RepID=UPI00240A9A73|nr:glycerate kinase [Intestinibaculum porci]MDD6350024.1 glycerate kinase [Intestinibaculum porci]